MPQLLGVAWALEWKLRILAGYQVYHQVGTPCSLARGYIPRRYLTVDAMRSLTLPSQQRVPTRQEG